MALGQAALAVERVGDRHLEGFGKRGQIRRAAARHHAAADVEHGPLGLGQRGHDALDRRRVDHRPRQGRGRLRKRVDGEVGREEVHRHVDQHGAGAARLREVERAFEDPRQIIDAIDAVDALAEGPEHLALVGVGMHQELLVRVTAVVVRRDVAGDDDHRNRVERGIGHARRGVREPRAEVAEHHAHLAGRARVAIGRVRGELLVPRRDEPDLALLERVEHPDHRVAAESEDDLDADPLEVLGDQVRGDPRARSRRRRVVWCRA